MGVLTPNLAVAIEQWWASPLVTRWFVGAYCAWILLGSVWGWYHYCDVDGAASARVAFIHTRGERVHARGDVTIHEYESDPRQFRFVGDARLEVSLQDPKVLKLSLSFHDVAHDEQMTIRCRPGPAVHTVGSLFSHSVKVQMPLPAGEHEIELSFRQGDVQYMMSAVDLAQNVTVQREIVIERSWLPFLQRGGVQVAIGSGWLLPLPDPAASDSFTHTGRRGYLLLTAGEPGEYEIVFPWVPDDPSYGDPLFLLDGAECPVEATRGPEPLSRASMKVRLLGQHVLCLELGETIVSPLSQWVGRDRRFLGFQIPWRHLEVRRK